MSASEERMAALTRGLPSKSAKIRALHGAGCSRSEIADFIGVRYQFVRNVIVDSERKEGRKDRQANPVTPGQTRAEYGNSAKVELDRDGKLAIPESLLAALGVKAGDKLIACLENGEIRLMTMAKAVSRAQAIVREVVPEGVSLVDELLEDRRREITREHEDA
jgi:bifunctional DNA-binding transcriptional regulator/antitoxin component of YhaV-PrlF toxin-antitoxin module